MKKITLVFFALFSCAIFSQEQVGNRAGTIFYSSVDKSDTSYSIYVDLFEPEGTKYIEAELYDDNDIKLSSTIVELIKEDNHFYIANEENGTKDKVTPEDINLKLARNSNSNNHSYPKVKVILLNENYAVVDFSQKIFY